VELEPIVTGNSVVALVEQADSRAAFKAFDLNTGRELWACSTFRNRLTALSTPVCFGAFVYFVTPKPNYLHRIDLASGIREVVAIERYGKGIEEELPGELSANAVPLLFGPCETSGILPTGCGKKLCLVLSSVGLIFLELEAVHSGKEPLVRATIVEAKLGGFEWTSPALLHKKILATTSIPNERGLHTLTADVSAYPEMSTPAVDRWTEGTKDADLRCFSPCISVQGAWDRDFFIWCGRDIENRLYMAMRSEQGDCHLSPLNVTVRPNDGSLAAPITNNRAVFTVGEHDLSTKMVIQSGWNRSPTLKELPALINTDQTTFIGEEGFFTATSSFPVVFNPYAANIDFSPPHRKEAYFNDRLVLWAARPAVGFEEVIVATNECLACYGGPKVAGR
jgi:hypothetical protein